MRTKDVDALVVGSGFGGAAVARRLAEAGYRVLVVEKGPAIDPAADFRQTQDPSYFRKYLKGVGDNALSLTWAEALGGGSGFYEMVSLRAPTSAFEQRDGDARRLWPAGLDRRALDPWYDIAERELRVEQIAPEDVPRTGLVFARLMKGLGFSCERARYAVVGCVGSGYCVAGCVYGAKQSLLVNYIPRAQAVGAELLTGYEAVALRPLAGAHAVPESIPLAGLPFRYQVTLEPTGAPGEDGEPTLRVRARLVILGGGTVGSARLLLRSRGALPRLSLQVGRNLAFNGGVKVAGLLAHDLPDGDMYAGRSHPGVVSYEFLESHGVMLTAAKALPLQIVAGVRLSLPGDRPGERRFGAKHVELLRLMRHRVIVLAAFGMTPPAGRLLVDEDGGTRARLVLDSDLRAYHGRIERLLASILERSGCRRIRLEWVDGNGEPYPDVHFSTTHQVGSCRMADDPRHGVVDVEGEVFGYPGLFVADGAAIPTSLAVNTSLTILANAERIAHGIVLRHPAVPPRVLALGPPQR